MLLADLNGVDLFILVSQVLRGHNLNATDNKIFDFFLNCIPFSGEFENDPVKSWTPEKNVLARFKISFTHSAVENVVNVRGVGNLTKPSSSCVSSS